MAAVDLADPKSLNRYAYVMNNPTTLADPLGLGQEDCTKAADPRACRIESYWGLGNSINPYVNPWTDDPLYLLSIATTPTALNFVYPVEPEFGAFDVNNASYFTAMLVPYYGNLAIIGAIDFLSQNNRVTGPQDLRQLFKPASRFNLIESVLGPPPEVCGGGGFGFAGLQADKGSAQAFFGGLLEYDTNTGWSTSGLFEVGKKSTVGGGYIANSASGGGLLFVPVAEGVLWGVPLEGGLLGTSSAVGAYAEAGRGNVGVGVGGYINLSRSGCQQQKGKVANGCFHDSCGCGRHRARTNSRPVLPSVHARAEAQR